MTIETGHEQRCAACNETREPCGMIDPKLCKHEIAKGKSAQGIEGSDS